MKAVWAMVWGCLLFWGCTGQTDPGPGVDTGQGFASDGGGSDRDETGGSDLQSSLELGSEPGQPLGGSTATGGSSSSSYDDVCERVEAVAEPIRPEMMVVLDRSGSMAEAMRWGPSMTAILEVVPALSARIDFGLALFPGTAVVVDPCTPGSIVVPAGPDTAPLIEAQLRAVNPVGGTPTPAILQHVLLGFGLANAAESTETRDKYVLLVTDGKPTCPAGGGRGQAVEPADVLATNLAVEALTQAGVKTYVIGYDTLTPGNEVLAEILDGFARRGGTGDVVHRPVEDSTGLIQEFERISVSAVPCSYTLDHTPQQASYVLVTLDGMQLNLAEADGWLLRDDRVVELKGAACATLRDGQEHHLAVEVTCGVVPPI